MYVCVDFYIYIYIYIYIYMCVCVCVCVCVCIRVYICLYTYSISHLRMYCLDTPVAYNTYHSIKRTSVHVSVHVDPGTNISCYYLLLVFHTSHTRTPLKVNMI